jgi:hypothetical protein
LNSQQKTLHQMQGFAVFNGEKMKIKVSLKGGEENGSI